MGNKADKIKSLSDTTALVDTIISNRKSSFKTRTFQGEFNS
jgi:hypothetical protein